MSVKSLKIFGNRHFWYILLTFCIIGTILYSPLLSLLHIVSDFEDLWLIEFTIGNILFLLPIIYCNYIFKLRGGITSFVLSAVLILPKALLLTPSPTFSVLISAGVISTGSVITLSFYLYNRNIVQLKYANTMLTEFISVLPVPILAIDRMHRVTQWNLAMESLTGIKSKDILGTDKYWKAFYPEKRPLLADLIVNGATEKEIVSYYSGIASKSSLIKGAFEGEAFFPMSGIGKWLFFIASPIVNVQGGVDNVVETVIDTTDRNNAESALRKSEKSYRDLFETALDAIWVNDLEGIMTAVNEGAARLTGYPREEMLNYNVKLFIDDNSLAIARNVKKSLMQKRPIVMPYEQRIIRKDGTVATCMLMTNLITDINGNAAFQNIARDMTEEKRLYENMRYYLEQITKAQEEERKRIARELHDGTLQTLIAMLHQLEYLLDQSNWPIKQAKELWSFYEQLRDVVHEIRRFSQDLRPAILDDFGLLLALEWLIQDLQNKYGIVADLIIEGEERRVSQEAELLMFRIVQESLSNVRKHSRATEVTITVGFFTNRIRVAISDNGIGFTVPEEPADLPRMGKLGLAGLEERAKLLGGTLTLKSQPGKGTTVTVEAYV